MDLKAENKKIREAYKRIHTSLQFLAVKNIQLENRIVALEEENAIYILGSLVANGSAIKKHLLK